MSVIRQRSHTSEALEKVFGPVVKSSSIWPFLRPRESKILLFARVVFAVIRQRILCVLMEINLGSITCMSGCLFIPTELGRNRSRSRSRSRVRFRDPSSILVKVDLWSTWYIGQSTSVPVLGNIERLQRDWNQTARCRTIPAFANSPFFPAMTAILHDQSHNRLKYRGVVYDVGLNFSGTGFSVEPFDPALVQHDLEAIANDLHANAVRIEGEDVHRLVVAAQAAHALGLTVYFNPWKMHATADETCSYLCEAAKAAEELRVTGVDVVLVVGCEYTIFSKGVFPGESFNDRIAWFGSQVAESGISAANIPDSVRAKSAKLNEILRRMTATARAEFGGPVTYSSGSWELVDWSIFDIVGTDYYRRGESAEEYVGGLEAYRVGKPLAVMEVGCCAYEGAAARGDGGFVLLQGTMEDGTGKFVDDVVPTRSETEQADYIETQLTLLCDKVDAIFVFVFSFPAMRKGEGLKDLDMMGFSLVKTFPDDDPRSKAMPPWAPKESFHRLADFYAREKEATP